jgi:hypothetical protein
VGIRKLVWLCLLASCWSDYDGGGDDDFYPRPDARIVDAGPDACVPVTCAARGASCGSVDDGCGGTLDCGTCAGLATCGGQGVDNVCALPMDDRTCTGGWCWEAPAPFAFNPTSVFASAVDDVWAVGTRGALLHFDGDDWRAVDAGTTADLEDIWMASASDGWLAGKGGVIRRWNGTAWTAVASNTTADLYGVWGTAANNVWFVGDTVSRRWNGSSLVAGAVSTPTLVDVFVAGSNVFAVGEGYVWQLVAGIWTKKTGDSPLFTSYSVSSIAGTATEAYALGREHGITAGEDLGYHWDGQGWTRHADPGDPEWAAVYADGNKIYGVSDESITNLADTTRMQGPGGTMRAASGVASLIFVATAPQVNGQLFHASSGMWLSDGGFGDRRGLSTMADVGDGIWFGGAYGTLIEWRGGIVVHEPPTDHAIVAIAGTSREDVWIASDSGHVYHFDGMRWHDMDAPFATHPAALAILDDHVFLVGDAVYRREDDSWVMETTGTDAHGWSAAAAHEGELFTLASDSTSGTAHVGHYANGTWSELAPVDIPYPCGIAVAGTDDVWVAGYGSTATLTDGLVAHWNGSTWTVETRTGAGQLCSILVNGGEVWVGGHTDQYGRGNATALQHRAANGTWTVSEPLPAGSVRALATHGGELWAAGDHGAIVHQP